MGEDDSLQRTPSNIPIPDPSLATAAGLKELESKVKGWVDSLQVLMEQKIERAEDKTASLDRVVQTRLAGSETALNAAMAAADKVTQKIESNFGAVLSEMRAGVTKQIDSLDQKIDDLKLRMSESGGKSQGYSSMAQTIVAVIAAAAAIGMFILVLSRPVTTVMAPSHQTFYAPTHVKI